MKKVVGTLLLMMIVLTNTVCYAAWIYPEQTVKNDAEITKNERVNVVFDNSGHDNVKQILINVFRLAAVAEHADVWLYPIAGSNEPVKIEPNKAFVEANFNNYSKSSNEFKTENMMDRAIADLNNDAAETKRLVLCADIYTDEIRPEYSTDNEYFAQYLEANPGILFTTFHPGGIMLSLTEYQLKQYPNYDTLNDKTFLEFFLQKYGYSQCESDYDSEAGMLKLQKGKANNNLVVTASDDTFSGFTSSEEGAPTYVGGCAMSTKAYEDYLKKSKVKGVALSYNHVVTDDVQDGSTAVIALFTLDGQTVDPANDDVYIPVINAAEVKVYHKESKGSGICTADATYNCEQDKKVYNKFKPESNNTIFDSEGKDDFFRTTGDQKGIGSDMLAAKESDGVFTKIWKGILKILSVILSFLFAIIRIGIFVFIIALIAFKKFRAYVQLKILGSKFGPYYEKISVKIKKIFKDILASGKKIKGDADLNKKFVFISKASADMATPNNRIELVVAELERRGIQCWLSEKGIKPGQNYNVVLPEAIRKCAVFLLFVSTSSVHSTEVVSEISTAKEYKKKIIPVQIEPFDLFGQFTDWSYMLKPYQKTDLFKSGAEEIKNLADYIEQTFRQV